MRASLALGLYAYLLWIVPTAHAAHHARYGADHAHTDAGVVALAEPQAPAVTAQAAHEEQHALFDALGLAEVATAGTLSVDCSLADLTLVECAAGALHAPGFGDALVAHQHAPTRAPDLEHGRGSLAHRHAAFVTTDAIALAPPSLACLFVLPSLVESQHPFVARRTHASRGPPLLPV